eukprot:CAMPEP_0173436436 /NCGR_PEP_ID=MMETSP1357-20121228/16137_1 /TAXON_ID=77926 /ORGANISM="Hemiselmis rufescens, Strain PCC563" /LENGTH=69 /DNA_ID=CAMNT_0014401513 /DNA_START=45 /DNA_END=251 /DNA_ORIENTATION=-
MEVLLDQRYLEAVRAVSAPGCTHALVNASVCPQRSVFPSHAANLSLLRAVHGSAFPVTAGEAGGAAAAA